MPHEAFEVLNTSDNLLIAFGQELNTQARYAAYAVRAEVDGLPDVAVLFRAIARAEQIHAQAHGHVLLRAGAEMECVVHDFSVRDTLENLETALRCELYEIEDMYPKFQAEATMEGNGAARRSFLAALEAEKSHAKMLEETIKRAKEKNSPAWTAAPHYYVCRACGHLAEGMDQHVNCPMYSSPDQFELIGADSTCEPRGFTLIP
jgi:rubrerythrin